MKRLALFLLIILLNVFELMAQNIKLPLPQKNGGMPLIEALSKRQTIRSISDKEISMQEISNLLWAAFGINRPDGRRTAPSVLDYKEIDLYVLLKTGIYLYDANSNVLVLKSNEDVRYLAGQLHDIKDAPVDFILVSDLDKMGKAINFDKTSLTYADAGHISQNIYLSAVSLGLATGVRHWVDRELISKKLKLKKTQLVTLCHCIGYEKK
jgi:SagB-type dehydrogenase family enzyme